MATRKKVKGKAARKAPKKAAPRKRAVRSRALAAAPLYTVELSLGTKSPGVRTHGYILRRATDEVVAKDVVVGRWTGELPAGAYQYVFGTEGKGSFDLGVSIGGKPRAQVQGFDTGPGGLAGTYDFQVP